MNRPNVRREEKEEWSWWKVGAAAAGVTAAAGGLYMMLRSPTASASTPPDQPPKEPPKGNGSSLSYLTDLLGSLTNRSPAMESAVSRYDVPARPALTNLNALLADIHVRYIALKREDFQLHFRVFTEIFNKLHEQMKAVDKYYERYATNVQFAGSHYDRLRIKRPDEFDMDIVIGLPVNMHVDPACPEESDIVIEQRYPGFVQLRAGVQYKKLLVRDGVDCLINRIAYEWLDERNNYILRSKFTDWFKGVGNRALNRFERRNALPAFVVDGRTYNIRTSSSGPAWTIIIEAPGFRLDVDLVPALKFPEKRWPVGRAYRDIPPACRRGYWLVVPKPNKAGGALDEARSWRLALQDQERRMLHDTSQLRLGVKLLKKLRDSQGMNKIASYYIKTLFLWEIVRLQTEDPTFWQRNDLATIFIHMLRRFYSALITKNIPYFWNKNHNLIENINSNILSEYATKCNTLLTALEDRSNYKIAAKYLLTSIEYREYFPLLYNN